MEALNKNIYLLAIASLLSSLGGRYCCNELSERCKRILDTPIVRKIIIFCIAFITTKDILKALLITLVFLIVINGFLHDGPPKPDPEQ